MSITHVHTHTHTYKGAAAQIEGIKAEYKLLSLSDLSNTNVAVSAGDSSSLWYDGWAWFRLPIPWALLGRSYYALSWS